MVCTAIRVLVLAAVTILIDDAIVETPCKRHPDVVVMERNGAGYAKSVVRGRLLPDQAVMDGKCWRRTYTKEEWTDLPENGGKFIRHLPK